MAKRISLSLANGSEASGAERLLQQRLNLSANLIVRVTSPSYVGLQIEWCVERKAILVRNEDAGLTRDEFGTQIVGMAAKAWPQAAVIGGLTQSRSASPASVGRAGSGSAPCIEANMTPST